MSAASGTTIELDGRQIKDEGSFQDLLSQYPGFPEGYGKNWNAFCDVVTGMLDLPVAIHMHHVEDIEARLPQLITFWREIIGGIEEDFQKMKMPDDFVYTETRGAA